jgi:hypothetical protein
VSKTAEVPQNSLTHIENNGLSERAHALISRGLELLASMGELAQGGPSQHFQEEQEPLSREDQCEADYLAERAIARGVPSELAHRLAKIVVRTI